MRSIGLTFLAWYMCGALLLVALLASVTTYHPSAQWLGEAVGVGSMIGAALCALVATMFGLLPPTHWVHRSRPLLVFTIVAASVVTLLFGVIV